MAILFRVEICTKTYKDNFCFAASATPMAVACDPDSMSACLATKQVRLWTSNLPQPFQRKICIPIRPKGQETLVCWLGGIGIVGVGWQVAKLWQKHPGLITRRRSCVASSGGFGVETSRCPRTGGMCLEEGFLAVESFVVTFTFTLLQNLWPKVMDTHMLCAVHR